ncbi:MAG: hypothetical protein NC310_08165 [Roseburia sp.]|nr:hypothetical protein [Anaeroplasma bactoclasticum]MCM1197023.1 hypothetical protein [Roseburia sp.]MCM1556668.1 hypothetical protein [Anaeroplasma bactoclasticum]
MIPIFNLITAIGLLFTNAKTVDMELPSANINEEISYSNEMEGLNETI